MLLRGSVTQGRVWERGVPEWGSAPVNNGQGVGQGKGQGGKCQGQGGVVLLRSLRGGQGRQGVGEGKGIWRVVAGWGGAPVNYGKGGCVGEGEER